ncbi:MAG TPA: rod shape-determining protein MreD, partial [Alphaproteobacteria bacterium]|nr:rod shape-determining protein MreD [Alphaproteobacteria bacterium]
MSLATQIDRTLQASLPVAWCFILVLFTLAPWPSPVLHTLADALPLMMICYWTVQRPEAFPMRWAFLLGFLQDMLSGQFLGVTALSYLLADFSLRSQRNSLLHQPFFFNWLIYALVLAGANILQWLLFSLLGGVMLDV